MSKENFSRRDFLKGMGLVSLGALTACAPDIKIGEEVACAAGVKSSKVEVSEKEKETLVSWIEHTGWKQDGDGKWYVDTERQYAHEKINRREDGTEAQTPEEDLRLAIQTLYDEREEVEKAYPFNFDYAERRFFMKDEGHAKRVRQLETHWERVK